MWGEDSYLIIDGKLKGSDWNWAFFGTDSYINKYPERYSSTFTLKEHYKENQSAKELRNKIKNGLSYVVNIADMFQDKK